jgi:hypothetical protein
MPAAVRGRDLEIDPALRPGFVHIVAAIQRGIAGGASLGVTSVISAPGSYTTNAMPSNRATELLMSRAPAMSLSFSCPRPSSSRPEPH